MTGTSPAGSGEACEEPAGPPRPRRARRRAAWLRRWDVIGVGVLAFIPRALTAGTFQTPDEVLWMRRSYLFSDALTQGRLDEASATAGDLATMPGVTTMWLGSIARGVWAAGRDAGLWSEKSMQFGESMSSVTVAQAAYGVATAALIALVAWLVGAWQGRVAGIVAGVLLATEPFLVAHGSVLHTDELLTLLGVASCLATVLALGIPGRGEWYGSRRLAALGGAGLGLAVLTKLSAAAFAPSVSAFGAWALIVAWRSDRRPDELRLVARMAAWMVGASVATLVFYPAIWVDTSRQLTFLRRAAEMGGQGQPQFFLGEASWTPGLRYYLVAVPFRLTPWLAILGLSALVASLVVRQLRMTALAVGLLVLPMMTVLSVASKQFDRYALVAPAGLAILVGAVAARWWASAPRLPTLRHPWVARPLLAVALAVPVVTATVVAPWGMAYFNPLFGGALGAEDDLLIGWGEGLEQAGAAIEERESARCDHVTIWTSYFIPNAFPCGSMVADPAEAEYVVLYVSARQLLSEARTLRAIGGRRHVASVDISGVRYADVYQREPAEQAVPVA